MGYQEIMNEHAKMLERYSGKSVDELLAITNGKDIDFLFAIEMAIQQKEERVSKQKLSEEERIVLAIEGLEREVNNGGYSQFSLIRLANMLRSSWILFCASAAQRQRRSPRRQSKLSAFRIYLLRLSNPFSNRKMMSVTRNLMNATSCITEQVKRISGEN
jgi:hypothetical protein